MNIRKWSKQRIVATLLATVVIVSMIAGCGGSETVSPSPEEPTPTSSPTTSPKPSPTNTTSPELPTAGFQLAKSDVSRVSSPVISASELDELVAGNNAFAFDLYQVLQEKEGNLFFSPYSISTALAMTYAGARTETESQMAETLNFTLPQDKLHSGFNALDLRLVNESRAEDFTLRIANSLWGQNGYPFLGEFLDVLAANYGAGLRLMDFATDPEPARITINDWVSDKTEEKIKDLIPQGAITDLTRLVLANAIYFNADWLFPFESNLTHDASFHTIDGQQIDVPMMSMNDPVDLLYKQGEGYQAVELPYMGGKAAMTLVVPELDSFSKFEATLDAELLETIVAGMEPKQVELKLPKFSYEQSIGMADLLAQMGMPDAFDPQVADFSGMDGTQLLYITDVFHKAFVAVDEEGTEAAAATAVIVGLESMPQIDVSLTVDRPFIYLIRDIDSGSILFMGRVLNPAA